MNNSHWKSNDNYHDNELFLRIDLPRKVWRALFSAENIERTSYQHWPSAM